MEKDLYETFWMGHWFTGIIALDHLRITKNNKNHPNQGFREKVIN
jgi:hypothetical protein